MNISSETLFAVKMLTNDCIYVWVIRICRAIVSCIFATGTLNRESSVDVIRLDVSRTFPHLGIFQKVNF